MKERPATLVDGHVIFDDGACRELTDEEQQQRKEGNLTRVQRADAQHGPYGVVNWPHQWEWELRRIYGGS